MEVEGVVHGVVGVHLVDQPDLDPLAHRELPVDGRAVGAAVARPWSMAVSSWWSMVMSWSIAKSPWSAVGWPASSFMPQLGQRPGVSLVTSGCIGQAQVTGPPSRHRGRVVHLGDQGQDLVRRRGQPAVQLPPLGLRLRGPAQLLERPRRRPRPARGHRHAGQPVPYRPSSWG
jgi:hypothetical protein